MFQFTSDIRGLIVDVDTFFRSGLTIDLNGKNAVLCGASANLIKVKDAGHFCLRKEEELDQWDVPSQFKQIKSYCDELELTSNHVVIVSKNTDLLQNYSGLSIGRILISDEPYAFSDIGFLPDIKVDDFQSISKLSSLENPSELIGGFAAEVMFTLLRSDRVLKGKRVFIRSNTRTGVPLYIGGRYYKHQDARSFAHQLSSRIRKSKNDATQEALFSSFFVGLIKHLEGGAEKFDAVTRVPPKPSSPRDRFVNITETICSKRNLKDYTKELVCVKDYGKNYKSLGETERRNEVEDAFAFTERCDGEHIILIDDVVTTGSTIEACAQALYSAGAKEVSCIVLAVNQFGNLSSITEKVQCENCGDDLVLYFDSRNGHAKFWCPGCRKVHIQYDVGWKQYIVQNQLDEMEVYDDDYLIEF